MSAAAPIVDLLSRVPLFGSLAEPERVACGEKFREFRLEKGQLLFSRGDPGINLFIVAEGQIRLAIATAEGRELSFQVVGRGDLFGEISLLDGGERSTEATVLTPTIVYSLDRAEFLRLRADYPAITDATIRFLCKRLRAVSENFESVALYPLDVRLARFLLREIRGLPDIAGRRTPLELHFSQSELAMLLGASRPKINAALGSLEEAGAIGRTSDRLFCDRSKLLTISERG